MHGGKAPQVQAAARSRLNALADVAVAALERALTKGPRCPHCGRGDADLNPSVINAAKAVLDRAHDAIGGFGRHSRVDHAHTHSHRLETLANLTLEEQLERVETMADRLRELIAVERAALPPATAVDGYLVPEDEDDSAER
jgi:hypothetical protein